MKLARTIGWALVTALATLGTGPAGAATVWEWNFSSSNDGCGSTGQPACAANGTTWGNQRKWTGTATPASSPAISVTASAWSNTGGNSIDTAQGSPSDGTIQSAYLAHFSGNGLGVQNRDGNTSDITEPNAPEHAIDNNQRFDSTLFDFGQKVTLTNVNIGWVHAGDANNPSNSDADLSIFAYIGTGAPTIAGQTYSSLISSSNWLKSDYDFTNGGLKTVNPLQTNAQYWLLTAYIPSSAAVNCNVKTDTKTGVKYVDPCDDYIKLAGLTATTNGSVPEPGTLGLLGLAVAGMVFSRRRTESR